MYYNSVGHNATLILGLTPVNQVIIQEEISNAERIRTYVTQELTASGRKTLCEGESMGHKRIQTFKSSPVSCICLLINESIEVFQIKNFSVYCKVTDFLSIEK